MSRKLLFIAGALGLGAWAYRAGKLPGAAMDAIDSAAGRFLPQSFWGVRDPAKDARAAAIKAASGGQVVPILGEGETVTVNKYEAILRTNMQLVQPWARQNLPWAAAIMYVENRALNPKARGDNGAAHGLYQVHVPTAETCYRAGYQRFSPTAAVLETVEGAVYFGTAEMDRLGRMGRGLDWTICAYNGGAGWEDQPPSYVNARRAYLGRVKKAFLTLYPPAKGAAV